MLLRKVITLIDGKRKNEYIWNINLFVKRTFTSQEDISIPTDKSLILHSPSIDGELVINGEGFIL